MKTSFSVRKKIILGFGILFIALGVVVVWSLWGITRIVGNAKSAIDSNQLRADLTQREIDHLNWAKKVSAFLTDASVKELTVETDPHKCAFGQWYYSDARQAIQAKIPELKAPLTDVESFHNQLHASATEIKDVFQRSENKLCSFLREKKINHLAWMHNVQDGLLDSSCTHLAVESDPTRCALGECLNSEEGRRMMESDPARGALVKDLLDPHRKLHESVLALNAMLAKGERQEAFQLYRKETTRDASATLDVLDRLIALEDQRAASVTQAMTIYAAKTKPALDEIQRLLGQTRETAASKMVSDAAMLATADSTRKGLGLLGGCALLAAVACAVLITRSIVKALSRVIGALKLSAAQLGTAAQQIAGASQALSENTSEQATSIEETAATLEELTTHAMANSDESEKVQSITQQTRQNVGTTLEAMRRTKESIVAMNSSSSKISAIIKTIEEIAFQTNLLALNAAVEAARAGEHGKGFAVVAEEVRNLAQRAGSAAHETDDLIRASIAQAESAGNCVAQTAVGMERVAAEMNTVADSISLINTASHEQSGGIEQINHSVAVMSDMTQKVASNSEEAAQTAEELTAQAEQLNQLVADLVRLAGSGAQG